MIILDTTLNKRKQDDSIKMENPIVYLSISWKRGRC